MPVQRMETRPCLVQLEVEFSPWQLARRTMWCPSCSHKPLCPDHQKPKTQKSTLGEIGSRHLSLPLDPRDFPLSKPSSFLGALKSPTIKLIHLKMCLLRAHPGGQAQYWAQGLELQLCIHRSQASSPNCILTAPQTDPSPLTIWVSSPLVKNLHLPRLSTF